VPHSAVTARCAAGAGAWRAAPCPRRPAISASGPSARAPSARGRPVAARGSPRHRPAPRPLGVRHVLVHGLLLPPGPGPPRGACPLVKATRRHERLPRPPKGEQGDDEHHGLSRGAPPSEDCALHGPQRLMARGTKQPRVLAGCDQRSLVALTSPLEFVSGLTAIAKMRPTSCWLAQPATLTSD
jgi:hypothetical protein